mmetsp:Transcript_6346/g.17845  ORF Transcript_6346/g.17845 Transcript_6346/m.17845 type:complete len:156 (-) Transcript_6346:1207-1674(-)
MLFHTVVGAGKLWRGVHPSCSFKDRDDEDSRAHCTCGSWCRTSSLLRMTQADTIIPPQMDCTASARHRRHVSPGAPKAWKSEMCVDLPMATEPGGTRAGCISGDANALRRAEPQPRHRGCLSLCLFLKKAACWRVHSHLRRCCSTRPAQAAAQAP